MAFNILCFSTSYVSTQQLGQHSVADVPGRSSKVPLRWERSPNLCNRGPWSAISTMLMEATSISRRSRNRPISMTSNEHNMIFGWWPYERRPGHFRYRKSVQFHPAQRNSGERHRFLFPRLWEHSSRDQSASEHSHRETHGKPGRQFFLPIDHKRLPLSPLSVVPKFQRPHKAAVLSPRLGGAGLKRPLSGTAIYIRRQNLLPSGNLPGSGRGQACRNSRQFG